MTKSAFAEALGHIPTGIADDIQEDIVGDLVLYTLENELPENLERLVKNFSEKNLSLYVKRPNEVSLSVLPTNEFGENKVTRIIDETAEDDSDVIYVD
jgi:hypothetical protein